MPDKLEVYQSDLCWLEWPQSREPLCPELAAFVARIDPEKDAELVKGRLGIRDECTLNLRIAEVFLKRAVAKGLSLAKIASLMYRAKEFSKSPLEKLVEKTRLTYDFLMRKADNMPTGVDLSPRSQAKEGKKGLFTPQKLHNRFGDRFAKPTPFDPKEDLEPQGKSGFLTPIKAHSNVIPSMPLNIFPLSYALRTYQKPDSETSSPLLSPFDGCGPFLESFMGAMPEVPTFTLRLNDFQMPRKDPSESKSACSVPWKVIHPADFPSPPSQFPLLEAISCCPRSTKTRKGGPRQTMHPNDADRPPMPLRSSTQERRGVRTDPSHENLCFLPNVKTSKQSLLELFFQCFELNVSRFLEEKARKHPRKYTVHLG
jgi:hypothetical protein